MSSPDFSIQPVDAEPALHPARKAWSTPTVIVASADTTEVNLKGTAAGDFTTSGNSYGS